MQQQLQYAISEGVLENVKKELNSLRLEEQLNLLMNIKAELSTVQRQFRVQHDELKRKSWELENKHTDLGKSIEEVGSEEKLVRGKDAKKYGHVLADWKLVIPHESMIVSDGSQEVQMKADGPLTTFSLGLFWLINNVDTFLLDKLCMELSQEDLQWISKTELVSQNPVLQPSLAKQLFEDFVFMVRQEPINTIFQGYDVVQQVVDLVLRTLASRTIPIESLSDSRQWTWTTICIIAKSICDQLDMTIVTTDNQITVSKDQKSFRYENDCVHIPK